MVDAQHQRGDIAVCAKCGGLIQTRLFRAAQGYAVAQPQTVGVVEIQIGITDPTTGEIRWGGEQKPIQCVERVFGVPRIFESNILILKCGCQRLQVIGTIDFADIARLRGAARQRVHAVDARDKVFEPGTKRCHHDQRGIVWVRMQHREFMGAPQIAGRMAIRRHHVKLDQRVKQRLCFDL